MDVSTPVSGDDEVLVRVQAAAVNALGWRPEHRGAVSTLVEQ
jgi:hypothetical protein